MPLPAGTTSPGILRCLATMAYETLLLLGILAVTMFLPHILIGTFAHKLATGLVLWANLFLVLLAYFVWFWSNGRQTLAMKTWRIRLITSDGQPLHPLRALLRYLLCWPSFLLCGIGIFWALADADRLFLHDRIAGTRLVMT